jgi:hypothetical protein
MARKGVSDAINTTDRSQAGNAQTGDQRDPNNGVRPRRVSMAAGKNLDIHGVVLDEENFYYRWFLDSETRGGRIQRAEAAGYEYVTDLEGRKLTRPSGGGTMFLMKLPMEYRLEDLQLKREKVQRTMEDQTRVGANEYTDGNRDSIVSSKSSDNPYS